MRRKGSTLRVGVLLLAVFALISNVSGQQRTESTMEGTVVSASRETMVVRGDDNHHQLFTFDRDSKRPRTLPAGTRVSVLSVPGDEAGVRYATVVTVLSPAPEASAQTGAQAPAPPPQAVRELERDIERQTKRWRLGIRGGVGMDPEVLLVGVHSKMGPFFSRDLTFRPSAEFGWGEVTKMIAVNADAAYRLPINSRAAPWSVYAGAGPVFTFLHQNFEDVDIDFGEFEFDTGLNIFSGVEFRKGTFFEVKTTVYSGPAPTLRLIFGYNF